MPDHRKVHKTLIPALGGVAVYCCVLIAFLVHWRDIDLAYTTVFLASLMIFITGVVDDIKPQKALLKLGIQILATFLVVYVGDIRISSLFGVFGIQELNYWISVLASCFVILTLINSMNLIDGINGLAASLGIFYFSFFAWIFYEQNAVLPMTICLAFIGSLIAFLRYNLIRPIIFLGDTGSTLLGLFASIFLLEFLDTSEANCNHVGIYAPYGTMLCLFLLPLFDTFRVAMQRVFKQQSPFSPDKTHIHHLFLRLGFQHYHITLILVSINIVLFIMSFCLQRILGDLLILTLVLGLFVLGFFILEFFITKKFKMRSHEGLTLEKLRIFIAEYWFLFFSIIVFALPFQRWATSIPILVYSILWVISWRGSDIRNIRIKYAPFISALLFFTPLFYYLLIEFNPKMMLRDIGMYVPFLLFPILLFLKREYFDLKKWYTILAFYLLGLLTFALSFIGIALVRYWSGYDASLFSYNRLLISNIPLIYYSMMLNFGIMACIYLQKSTVVILKSQWISSGLILFLGLNIIIIHSKVGFAIMALILLISTIIQWLQYRKLKSAFYSLAIVLVYFFAFVWSTNKLNIQYQEHTSVEVSKRVQQWKASIDLICDNPIVGYGSTLSDYLYQKTGLAINSHNIFFESWLNYGLLGIVLIVFVFSYSYYTAIRSRDFFYLGFLSLIICYGMVESLFSNQTGVVFFSIFNTLLLLKSELRIKT